MTNRASSLRALADEGFDLLIVGAGIHGACAAWAATRLGLRVALIDRDDYGAATSANSLKVIHGGLRYLQHGNLKRMRESIRARRRFLALAPHHVSPQAFAIPVQGRGVRSRPALRIALALNDAISADRNRGLPPEQRLPVGRLLSKSEAAALWPLLPESAYDGAAVWHDALAHNTERLTLSFVLAARGGGAVAANYLEASRLIVEDEAVAGVEVRDVLDGAVFPIRARRVLNAAGPWWQQWTGRPNGSRPLVGAWNIIVKRNWFGACGVGLESTQEHRDVEALVQRGKRNLFFVPWRGGTMIGTVYEPFAGDPADYKPTRESVAAFLREINAVLPGANLTMDDITLMHVGVQPASTAGGSPEPDKHSEIVRGPARGCFSIKGVKYTTGLTVGEQAALDIARDLGRSAVFTGADALPADACPAPNAASVSPAEIHHVVVAEDAQRLVDFVLRRTGIGTFERPENAVCEEIATRMAVPLGWTPARQAAELDHLAAHYARFTPGSH
ncbi:MAG TPA: FAD-dependent oxidoreductase [Kiritimatiellia bacterium]|nr:FAD-dependent oxidoreductase [Kiritimatiellia bacterium]